MPIHRPFTINQKPPLDLTRRYVVDWRNPLSQGLRHLLLFHFGTDAARIYDACGNLGPFDTYSGTGATAPHLTHKGRLVRTLNTDAGWYWSTLPSIVDIPGTIELLASPGAIAWREYARVNDGSYAGHASSIKVETGFQYWAFQQFAGGSLGKAVSGVNRAGIGNSALNHVFGRSLSQTSRDLWVDGSIEATDATDVGNTSTGRERLYTHYQASQNVLYAKLAVYSGVALPDEHIRELTANPWGQLVPWTRRLYSIPNRVGLSSPVVDAGGSTARQAPRRPPRDRGQVRGTDLAHKLTFAAVTAGGGQRELIAGAELEAPGTIAQSIAGRGRQPSTFRGMRRALTSAEKFTDAVSVAWAFYLPALPGGSNYWTAWYGGQDASTFYGGVGLYIDPTGYVVAQKCTYAAPGGGARRGVQSVAPLVPGRHYVVVGVYPGGSAAVSLYINGEIQNGTASGTAPGIGYGSTVYAGVTPRDTASFWKTPGLVSHYVLAWHRLLTEADARRLYDPATRWELFADRRLASIGGGSRQTQMVSAPGADLRKGLVGAYDAATERATLDTGQRTRNYAGTAAADRTAVLDGILSTQMAGRDPGWCFTFQDADDAGARPQLLTGLTYGELLARNGEFSASMQIADPAGDGLAAYDGFVGAANGGAWSEGFGLYWFVDGYLHFWLGSYNTGLRCQALFAGSPGAAWRTIGVRYRARGEVSIFIDGKLAATASGTATINGLAQPVCMGQIAVDSLYSCSVNWRAGVLYDRALSDGEFAALHARGDLNWLRRRPVLPRATSAPLSVEAAAAASQFAAAMSLAGQLAGKGAGVGQLAAAVALGAQLAGAGVDVGTFAGVLALAAELAGKGGGSGRLAGSIGVNATLAGEAIARGDFDVALQLAGAMAGKGAGVGELDGALQLAAALAGVNVNPAVFAGAVQLAAQLSGKAGGAGALAGALELGAALAGVPVGGGSFAAAVSLAGDLIGKGGGRGSFQAAIAIGAELFGSARAAGEFAAALVLSGALDGAGAGVGELAAALALAGELAGTTNGGIGELAAAVLLAGSLDGKGAGVGGLAAAVLLSGTLRGQVDVPQTGVFRVFEADAAAMIDADGSTMVLTTESGPHSIKGFWRGVAMRNGQQTGPWVVTATELLPDDFRTGSTITYNGQVHTVSHREDTGHNVTRLALFTNNADW